MWIYPNHSAHSSQTPPSQNSSEISQMYAPSDGKVSCNHLSCHIAHHLKTMKDPNIIDEYCHTYHYRKARAKEIYARSSASFVSKCKSMPSGRFDNIFMDLKSIRRHQEIQEKQIRVFRLSINKPEEYIDLFMDFVLTNKEDEPCMGHMIDHIAEHGSADVMDKPLPQEEFMNDMPNFNKEEAVKLLKDILY